MPRNKTITFNLAIICVLSVGLFVVCLQWYETFQKNQLLQKRLLMENTLYKNQLNEFLKRYDSLYQNISIQTNSGAKRNTELINDAKFDSGTSNKPSKTKGLTFLKASNVSVRGVRVKSNDILETSSADKINQMRIRFTLEKDNALQSGAKKILVQLVNLQGNGTEKIRFASKFLSKEFFKDSSNPDACLFIDLKEHLSIGEYKINLICEGNLIGSTNFRVN
ncbi:hypothetical protein LZZ90_01685 [Flavobacterium sp. SM15]|uniref:hypothetical protein n=1 Tax=Flavobacterium sp. SM15 TaxID=2908005 RepID=UPI001EDB42B1|nr:hypothetical protein [Flavobacterium sp. SM15]MCG2610213.1 hypothetical protein [Flavobacterium sp. SM15]